MSGLDDHDLVQWTTCDERGLYQLRLCGLVLPIGKTLKRASVFLGRVA